MQASAEELRQFALAHGPAYQHPRRVFFVDQLPLAGTNKIDRQQLRKLAADRGPERGPSKAGGSRG
jgi:acyl-coenzyme A synthetase/AMP-(fatty) acid ligase